MSTQIPLFRAKKIDGDEYVEGLLCKNDFGNLCIQIEIDDELEGDYALYEIDPSTLSIHFPDILDSNGDKIFASLSEDGRGGDRLHYKDGYEEFVCEHTADGIMLYEYLDNGKIKNTIGRCSSTTILWKRLTLAGIQQ